MRTMRTNISVALTDFRCQFLCVDYGTALFCSFMFLSKFASRWQHFVHASWQCTTRKFIRYLLWHLRAADPVTLPNKRSLKHTASPTSSRLSTITSCWTQLTVHTCKYKSSQAAVDSESLCDLSTSGRVASQIVVWQILYMKPTPHTWCNRSTQTGIISTKWFTNLWPVCMRTSFRWEGRGRYSSFYLWITTWVAGKTVWSLENACHTWAPLWWGWPIKRRYIKYHLPTFTITFTFNVIKSRTRCV